MPKSFSVYRGQADQGIGEAGTPIRRGEQFIAADAPLQSDPELLRALRDWMTLDATPGDHGRLQDRLEGWACFPSGPYYLVVRLSAAGKYDRRDAYFSHARAWPLNAFAADFDPGLYLGADSAFLGQAPPAGADTEATVPAPTIEPLEPILANKGLAVNLIAHLFHGMVTGFPVIMAVPISDFARDATLARIVAFARGALPGRLRRRCRIRLFSRDPQRFLGAARSQGDADPGPADLLVIPEELAVAALTAARRRALLLDAGGERRDGPEPAAGLFDYAHAVIDSAQRFPAHLTAFGERFDQVWPDVHALPGPDQTHWVTLTYNLAVAFTGGEAQCGSLFATFLLNQARATAHLPWSALIRSEEWARFPLDQLVRFILRAAADLSQGEGQFQGVLAGALQQRGATVDAALAAWWNLSDRGKRQRLFELCDLDPPLISAEQSVTLARTLTVDDPASWPAAETADLARQLLQHPRALIAMDDLSARLFARLQREPQALDSLSADLDQAIRLVDAAAYPATYLELAGLIAQTRPAQSEALLQRFWAATDGLEKTADPAGLLDQGLAGRWTVLNIDTLMRLEPEISTARLIQHGAWLAWRRAADRTFDRNALRGLAMHWIASPMFADLRSDAAWLRPPQWRASALPVQPGPPVDTSAFRPLSPALPHQGGGRWLDQPLRYPPSAGGRGLGGGGLSRYVDTTMETWHQVLEDLGSLALDDIRLLVQPQSHWPWIYPFQWDQCLDLAARCVCLAALVELVAALVRPTQTPPDELCALLWSASSLREREPDTTLARLRDAVAEILEPGLGARRAEAAGVADLIAALARPPDAHRRSPDDASPLSDDALQLLRQRLNDQVQRGERAAETHPLIQLWQAILDLPQAERTRGSPLIEHGWTNLQAVIANEGAFYDSAVLADGGAILPILRLASALHARTGEIGCRARWLIYQPAAAQLRRDPQWWLALLGSVLECATHPEAQSASADSQGIEAGELTLRAALGLIACERPYLPGPEALALACAWQTMDIDRWCG